MLRNIAVGLLCVIGAHAASAPLSAASNTPVELTTEFSAKSKYRLDYGDWNSVLGNSVLEMGPSTHKRARKLIKKTGSSVRLANPLPSRFEGNRVMLHEFSNDQVELLGYIRDDLLALPDQLPLEKLNKNEQLAYWLNLHNAIVLAKMAEIYPVTLVEKTFSPERKKSFFHQRKFKLNGKKISLADIQNHVITNWEDPRVIYGFYMGAIGTPNIRSKAFTGKTVYKDLEDNAADFINSIRGTQIWNKDELRVSTYFTFAKPLFPNFEADLLTHIREYARGSFQERMAAVTKLSVKIDDWHVADLYNGKVTSSGRAGTTTTRRGNDAMGDGYPEHVMDILRHRAKQLAAADTNQS